MKSESVKKFLKLETWDGKQRKIRTQDKVEVQEKGALVRHSGSVKANPEIIAYIKRKIERAFQRKLESQSHRERGKDGGGGLSML